MSETNDTTRRGKTLSLKKTETSTVKQSFSHGRTKAVVVEKKRARVAPAASAPTAKTAETASPAPSQTPAPGRPAQAGGMKPAPSRAGVVLRQLTDEEKEARSRA
ncbi:MAG: translation initiation factor IF-2 associated domain-containing protein, partial [Rhizomicrobium sp.]